MCRVEVQLQAFITWALNGAEWSASRPGRFTFETHWGGGRIGLDAVEKKQISCLCRESNPDFPIIQ
jgi:hypothetical protein